MSRIATSTGTLFELQRRCLARNLAFVTFCLPGSNDRCTFIQHRSQPLQLDSLLQIDAQPGFILAPFHPGKKFPVFLLKPDLVIHGDSVEPAIMEEISNTTSREENPDITRDTIYESTKEEFLQQAESVKTAINSGTIDKAVLSRVHLTANNVNPDGPEIFSRLCNSYPDVFRYLLHIPGAGCWTGASPEPLLEISEAAVKTVSLAGTQKLNGAPVGDVKWQTKEIDEQDIVTAYIENLLSDFGITGYQKNGPYSQQAANMVHLKTTFSFDRAALKAKPGEFIAAIHPTPSVCGLPKEAAFEVISQCEKHERGYYTGFLGPINMDGCTILFVNLRCLRILPDQFALFAGAGITAGSNAEHEWAETELKMQTLLSVLTNPDHGDE